MNERITSYSRKGLVFDVVDEGPLDGDPVVLLHGFPERSGTWAAVSSRLHPHGLRTYAPDQRGYSPRARPYGRWNYRLDALTEDVVALIEAIGRPVHLVGHDWGSAVGWSVAAKRPDLVRTWTAVSVPHPMAFVKSWFTSTQGLKSWYMGLFQIPFLVEAIGRYAPKAFLGAMRKGGMTREEVERCRTDVLEYGALPGGLGWYRGLPLLDRSTRNPHVTVPTTLVWSDGDVALGRKGPELTPDFVDGDYEFVELRGVSHWIPTQAPDALVEAILDRIAGA